MPVDQFEWKNGKRLTSQKHEVLEFLEANHPFAYSAGEIGRKAIDLYPDYESLICGSGSRDLRDAMHHEIERSLEALIETDHVEAKDIDDNSEKRTFYRVKRP